MPAFLGYGAPVAPPGAGASRALAGALRVGPLDRGVSGADPGAVAVRAAPDGSALLLELALEDADGAPVVGAVARAWLTDADETTPRQLAPGVPASGLPLAPAARGVYRLTVPARAWPAERVTHVRVVVDPGTPRQATFRARVRPTARYAAGPARA